MKTAEQVILESLNTDRLLFSYRELLAPAVQKWHDEEVAELKELLKQAKEIMNDNLQPNPHQHAVSDMYHFVNNELADY